MTDLGKIHIQALSANQHMYEGADAVVILRDGKPGEHSVELSLDTSTGLDESKLDSRQLALLKALHGFVGDDNEEYYHDDEFVVPPGATREVTMSPDGNRVDQMTDHMEIMHRIPKFGKIYFLGTLTASRDENYQMEWFDQWDAYLEVEYGKGIRLEYCKGIVDLDSAT